MNRDFYKKVYVEISNTCNLNCSFCSKTKRKKETLSIDQFKLILEKIKPYTRFIYLHVLGEPLLHRNINELINIANCNDFNVNITTNGYLIKNLNSSVRQVNFSLHSFDEKYGKSLEDYMFDIFQYAQNNLDTYVNFRLWVNSKYSNEIINLIEQRYHVNVELNKSIKLSKNVYLGFNKEFIWPSNDGKFVSDRGKCYALKDHIAILSNGTVTACCLDSEGLINLGNIFKEDLKDIISSKLYQDMLNGFKNNLKIHNLCKKCNFSEIRFNK